MLEIEHLEFAYDGKNVLNDVSFRLNGGVGCLLGPNGAGKSTLLKCISGILKPKKGKIALNGVYINGLSAKDRAKFVSYAPQEFSVAFPYSVFDIVLMGRNPYVNVLEGPKCADVEKARSALETLQIDAFGDVPFTSLSGGEKRLVLIARALAQDGALMLFDEPTSFLDFKNQILVLSVIKRISRKLEKLVLLSLHDPNLTLSFCDEVFLIKNGVILESGAVEEVVTEENLDLLYSLKAKIVEIDGRKIVVPEKLL